LAPTVKKDEDGPKFKIKAPSSQQIVNDFPKNRSDSIGSTDSMKTSLSGTSSEGHISVSDILAKDEELKKEVLKIGKYSNYGDSISQPILTAYRNGFNNGKFADKHWPQFTIANTTIDNLWGKYKTENDIEDSNPTEVFREELISILAKKYNNSKFNPNNNKILSKTNYQLLKGGKRKTAKKQRKTRKSKKSKRSTRKHK
jgi:hypothetical protein